MVSGSGCGGQPLAGVVLLVGVLVRWQLAEGGRMEEHGVAGQGG